MRRFHKALLVSLALFAILAAASPGQAGRVGGPANQTVTLAAGASANFEVAFTAGEPAVVRLVGDGRSIVVLNMYDADGHVSTGVGRVDQRTVSMDVYRTGVFRIEIINLGVLPKTVLLLTN